VRAAAADPDFTGPSARRLVLVSDLLEYEPQGFSLYAADASFEAWQNTEPRGAPALDDVAVRVAELDRPDHSEAQTRAEEFWRHFFDTSGAREIGFDAAPSLVSAPRFPQISLRRPPSDGAALTFRQNRLSLNCRRADGVKDEQLFVARRERALV
jgi:hypothetical protein